MASKRACAEDRASLVDDTYALASAGLVDVSQALRVRSVLGFRVRVRVGVSFSVRVSRTD